MLSPTIRSFHLAVVLAACFGLFTAGCGHPTAIITASTAPPSIGSTDPAHPTNLPGVPFYVKRGMCKRETVWAQTQFTLQVDVLVAGKPVTSRAIVIPRAYILANKDAATPLRILMKDLDVLSAAREAKDLGKPTEPGKPRDPDDFCPKTVSADWSAVDADVHSKTRLTFCDEVQVDGCETIAAAEADGNLMRLANNASIVTEVDYEHVYYMNTKTPWIGNASVDAKLLPDGTLGEGNLQANDQTWSTILQTIGGLATDVATVGAAKYGAAASAAATATTTTATAPSSSGTLMRVTSHDIIAETPPHYCESIPGWPVPKIASTDNETTETAPKAGKTGEKPTAAGKTDKKTTVDAISYQFSITPTVYLHDYVSKDDGIKVCVPDTSIVTRGSFTITKVDDIKGKDDPNTIKVSGQVVLPKTDSDTKK